MRALSSVLARMFLALLPLALPAGGCSQFGVPDFPPSLRAGDLSGWEVLVVYHPPSVLGFGHTGVIVAADVPGRYLRFDQYASAEITYSRRLAAGRDGFWDPIALRLPSIFGYTTEYITRREGPDPRSLAKRGELLLPLPGLSPGPVRRAAEARYARAFRLEQKEAEPYYLLSNNCHNFVRDILREGGSIHERYFPKHFVEDYLSDFARKGGSGRENDPEGEPSLP